MKFVENETMTRCVSVGCDEDVVPIEWSYFGTYLIGQTVSLYPSVARTSHPFLLGRTIEEERDDDIQIPVVDKSTYPIHEGFTSEEPTNESLATMMEHKIVQVVGEYRAGILVFPTTSNEPSIVAEMEHNLAQKSLGTRREGMRFCEEQPGAWLSNHDNMHALDKLEHSNLLVEDVPSTSNIRRIKLYHQMAITMNGGPMGKGVRIQHPKFMIGGIHTILPDPDGNYMGHKKD
jgi:hypothetical protein